MKTDILIIGQGLAGTLLAHELYKTKVDFKVVSNSKFLKASEVAAGLFNPLVYKRLTKSWCVDDCMPVTLDTYQEMENLLNDKFLYKKDMIKPLSNQEKELWEGKRYRDNFSDYITDIKRKKPVRGIHDFDAYGLVTKTGSVDLFKMLNAYKGWLIDNGLLIDDLFEYNDLEVKSDGIKWKGIQAKKVVFCEGFRLIHNPYFNQVKLKPTKGELLVIYCEDLSDEYILNKKLFVLPIGDNKFKIGATYDWQNLNEDITSGAKQDLLERFEKLVSLPYQVLHHYAGIRPTVVDRRPVLGNHPDYSKLFIFNGLGTKGVMLAPYFAQQMKQFILHAKDDLLHPEVNVNRFYK